MDFTVFSGAGGPLGMALLGMLAASLAGAVIGVLAPGAAYRRLREDAAGDRRFDPDGTLRNKVLVFQAAGMTGLPYGLVAAFFMAIQCGVLSGGSRLPSEVADAMPRLLLAVGVLGAANLVCGALKGMLAGRQLETIAWEPERFGPAYVKALLPETGMILALVFYMLTAIGI